MAKASRKEVALWILAGVGAGTLGGALIGLLLSRRAAAGPRGHTEQNVEELTKQARQVLGELTQSVEELADKTRQIQSSVSERL